MSLLKRTTFNRLELYQTLKAALVLRSVYVQEHSILYDIISWKEYWGQIPDIFKDYIHNLKTSWQAYIESGFDYNLSDSYSKCYLSLIDIVYDAIEDKYDEIKNFINCVLGFENFTIISEINNQSNVFAGATTSYRNPMFLSFCNRGFRKNWRNDSIFIPLLTASYKNKPYLFYHYRKQAVISRTDKYILFYPHSDIVKRPDSFRGFEKLKESFVSNWDSRVEERSEVIVQKVITPILNDSNKKQDKSYRFLDVGSGDGKYTSKIVSKLIDSGVVCSNGIEITLLDILSEDPIKYFKSSILKSNLSKVDYYSSDIINIDSVRYREGIVFDFIFFFRIMHNLSIFKIGHSGCINNPIYSSRYGIYPFMSNYYRLLLKVFPNATEFEDSHSNDGYYYPIRSFNTSSLLLSSGKSVIEVMASLSKYILIEDGDLTPDILLNHITQYLKTEIYVYDLSKHLRLSINHIYIISCLPIHIEHGTQIWPALQK